MHACLDLMINNTEPYVFYNSHFGDGQYPIVYSDVNCGGWEDLLVECEFTKIPELTCSRKNTAGVLCGYGMFIYSYNEELEIVSFFCVTIEIVLMEMSDLYKVHIKMKELLKYVSVIFGV